MRWSFLRQIWRRRREVFLGDPLAQALKRNRDAARALDAVVKEMLEQ